MLAMGDDDHRDVWFRGVVEYYTPRLMAILARYPLDGWTGPEDAVQEILVAAVAAFDSGTLPLEEPELGRWMYAGAREKAVGAARRRRRRNGLRQRWTEWRRWTGGAKVYQPNAGDSVGRWAARGVIMRLIEQLPELQSRVLFLHVVEERPFQEIADIIERSTSTVSTSYYRAMDHLRKSLTHEELEILRGLLFDSDRRMDEGRRRTVSK